MSHVEPTPPAQPIPADSLPPRCLPTVRLLEQPVSPWRGFIAWPGAASMVTLLSAACLLGGLWGVLEPTLADPAQSGDRWSVLATVAGYVACLLPAVWAMCRARAGNPDAVAATVVAAALAVGYGVVLHLIAPGNPLGGACAAAAGVLGLAGLWRGWRRSAGAMPSAATVWLALIVAWAVLWPALLGWRTATAEAPVGGGLDVPVMAAWTSGWLLLLGLVVGLLVAAMAGPDPWAHRERPFLSRPAMAWVLALVAAGCAVIALGVQAHVAGLDLLRSDLLPHLAILLLVGNELRHRAVGAHAGRDALALAVLPWLAAWDSLGGGPRLEDLTRGAGWAPGLLQLATTAPGLPLGLALVGAALAWRRRSAGLAIGAALALAGGVLAWDPRQPLVAEALALGGLIVAVGAWGRGRLDLVAAATAGAAACLGGSRLVADLLHLPTSAGTGFYAGCMTLVAWAGFRPAAVSATAVRLAACCLGLIAIGLARVIGGQDLGGQAWQVWLLICLAIPLLLWCGWRRRDQVVAAAAAPAILILVWPLLRWLIPKQKAWLGVWAAFALLVAAVGLAVRRARRQ